MFNNNPSLFIQLNLCFLLTAGEENNPGNVPLSIGHLVL